MGRRHLAVARRPRADSSPRPRDARHRHRHAADSARSRGAGNDGRGAASRRGDTAQVRGAPEARRPRARGRTIVRARRSVTRSAAGAVGRGFEGPPLALTHGGQLGSAEGRRRIPVVQSRELDLGPPRVGTAAGEDQALARARLLRPRAPSLLAAGATLVARRRILPDALVAEVLGEAALDRARRLGRSDRRARGWLAHRQKTQRPRPAGGTDLIELSVRRPTRCAGRSREVQSEVARLQVRPDWLRLSAPAAGCVWAENVATTCTPASPTSGG